MLARDGGRRSRVFDYVVEQDRLFESIRMGRNQRQDPQPSIVEGHFPPPSPRVDFVFSPLICNPNLECVRFGARLFSRPSEPPKDVLSASSSGYPRIVGGGQDGNPYRSAALKNGALCAPCDKKVDAGSVKEEPAVRPRWPLPFDVPSSIALNLVSYKACLDGTRIELRMVGRD